MGEETLTLPEVFHEWIKAVSRYPMFDVWREGRLCSVRLMHILRPERGSPWDIFAHWQRLRDEFPPAWLPLGYDAFGNILFWDLEGGGGLFGLAGLSVQPSGPRRPKPAAPH